MAWVGTSEKRTKGTENLLSFDACTRVCNSYYDENEVVMILRKSPVWAWERCRIISLPRFLVECRTRRLNQGSFVLLCFVFAFSELCLVFVVCWCLFLDLSSVTYFPAYTDVNGTV